MNQNEGMNLLRRLRESLQPKRSEFSSLSQAAHKDEIVASIFLGLMFKFGGPIMIPISAYGTTPQEAGVIGEYCQSLVLNRAKGLVPETRG